MNAFPFDTRPCRKAVAPRVAAFALSLLSLPAPGPALARDHVLGIRGEGFSYAVKEPSGWLVDSTIAREFGVDAILYPVSGDPHSADTPVIRVVLANKLADDANAALNHETGQYRSRHRNVKSAPLAVAHPRYHVAGRRICVGDEFCDYITHITTGTAGKVTLSVVLHRPGRPAKAGELAAYQRIVASVDDLVAQSAR